MSANISGSSIQLAYSWYRNGKLLVNRRYQRKLVWTLKEKQKLIDSILNGYPLPLFLLAETSDKNYEIIDGTQRFNAIFSFIELGFDFKKQYFDLQEFSLARQEKEKGSFSDTRDNKKTLSKPECANLLNYHLAITRFTFTDEKKINKVFSRINASGRQLSNQEKRQAGVVSDFADLVKTISSDIRGDVSPRTLKLYEMPTISIETKKEIHGYRINAEETLWCRHGISLHQTA